MKKTEKEIEFTGTGRLIQALEPYFNGIPGSGNDLILGVVTFGLLVISSLIPEDSGANSTLKMSMAATASLLFNVWNIATAKFETKHRVVCILMLPISLVTVGAAVLVSPKYLRLPLEIPFFGNHIVSLMLVIMVIMYALEKTSWASIRWNQGAGAWFKVK